MKKITINEFFASKEKLAIRPMTYENVLALCKAFDKKGYAWKSGAKYTHNNYYSVLAEKTCYDNTGTYGEAEFYESEGFTIIEFKDVDLS